MRRAALVWCLFLIGSAVAAQTTQPANNLCNFAAQIGIQVTTLNVDGQTYTVWVCTAQPGGTFKWIVQNSTNPPNPPTLPNPPIVPVNANQVNGLAVPSSQPTVGTNALGQLVAGTAAGVSSVTGGGVVSCSPTTGSVICSAAGVGGGTVTSVGLSLPASIFSVSGSPVTGTGSLTATYATGQTANQVVGSNSSGAVGLMSLTTAQLPTGIPSANLATMAGDTVLGSVVGGTPISLSAANIFTILNTISPSLVAGANVTISGGWPNQTINSSGGAIGFGTLTSGTNTGAAMVVGSGASLGVTGSGTITATSMPGTGITGANSIPASTLPLATSGAFGAVKPDGTSITITGGVISAASGSFMPSPAIGANMVLTSDGTGATYGFNATGPSGALQVVSGQLDIVTSVIPRLAATNPWTGSNDFSAASLLKIKVGSTAPACAVTGDEGSIWLDTTTATANHLKVCAEVSSTIGFQTIF